MNEYCVDLAMAKELKSKGFPQTSRVCCQYVYGNTKESILLIENSDKTQIKECCLPCSEEILEELPKYIDGNHAFYIEIIFNNNNFLVCYHDRSDWYQDKKLANALALLWIYLKKRGI